MFPPFPCSEEFPLAFEGLLSRCSYLELANNDELCCILLECVGVVDIDVGEYKELECKELAVEIDGVEIEPVEAAEDV